MRQGWVQIEATGSISNASWSKLAYNLAYNVPVSTLKAMVILSYDYNGGNKILIDTPKMSIFLKNTLT